MLTARAWMEREGIAQEALARRLDRSFVSINRYLQGWRPWPFDVVVALKKMSNGELTDESFTRVAKPPTDKPAKPDRRRRTA